ncbi:MAG: glycoside hydrolase family 2 TIM barrel-domain containing protein [Peptostreptococcaceae bacterium]
MRQILNINDSWNFIQENIVEASAKEFNTSNWESVNVPHTWNAIDGSAGNEFYRGACWYRKSLNLDKHLEGKRIYIEFNAINSVSNVYVNGVHLGEHRGGYSIIRYDITNLVEFGKENIIAVQADNSAIEDVYPLMADFTFYGGIYRDVNIVITEDVHFDLMNKGSKGVFISQDEVTNEYANITVKTAVVNNNEEEQAVRVVATVFNAEGKMIKYNAKDIVVKDSTEVSLPITVENPTLWNSVENPYLYNVQVTVERHNDLVDELNIATGLRYFHFDPKEGFFLNGKHLKLQGVSRHQDKKEKGWALSKEDHELDIALIKEVGANSIRLAHYQHDQHFYDLCDREGMVIWAEIPFISRASEIDFTGQNAKDQMVELIRQNYNHSSIVMWGVQNEIQIGGDLPYVRNIVKELNDLVHLEDKTRLTTQAQVTMVPDTDDYNSYTDLTAYNKYFGWYHGKPEEFDGWLDEFHTLNPNKCIGISEYGAEGIITYHTDTPSIKDYTEEYHSLYHEIVIKIFNEKPFVWGSYVWNFFDFGSAIRDEGGIKGRNNKGLMTFDRKIKKDAFYAYKSIWSKDYFVHITSKRFIDRTTETINIKVYSNCDDVTLFINEEKISTLSGEHNFVFQNVKLVNGQNHVIVIATKDGQEFTDYALFNKVSEENLIYKCVEEIDEPASNWFNEELFNILANVEIVDLYISDDVLSTTSTLGEIMENPDGLRVLQKYIGQVLENPMLGLMKTLTLDNMAKMSDGRFDPRLIFLINKELITIKK